MFRVLFFFLLLAGCSPTVGPASFVSRDTGLSGRYSSEVLVSQHRHFSVYAQATVVGTEYGIFLRHGLGEGSPIYADTAWADGNILNWHPVPRDMVCGGIRCVWNMGYLALSPPEFRARASTGMNLRLITSEGPIDLSLPASLFSGALETGQLP